MQSDPLVASNLYFIDSSMLPACHIRLASSNKVFKRLARKGKSSVGWEYGFKLHLAINNQGQIAALKLTHAAKNDGAPVLQMTQHLQGKLVADKDYISLYI